MDESIYIVLFGVILVFVTLFFAHLLKKIKKPTFIYRPEDWYVFRRSSSRKKK